MKYIQTQKRSGWQDTYSQHCIYELCQKQIIPSVCWLLAADGFTGSSAEKDSLVTNARPPGEFALHAGRMSAALSVYSFEEQICSIHRLLQLPVSYRSANYLRTTLRALQFTPHFIHLSFLKMQLGL